MLFFLFLMIHGYILLAQDEQFYRKLLSQNAMQTVKPKVYHYKANSSFYQMDLNNDGKNEGLVLEKKDGEDWVHLYNQNGKPIHHFSLEPNGKQAKLYKATIHQLSNRTKIVLLHFYEGNTDYIEFTGAGRVYFLTIDDNDLKTASIFKGPTFWHEHRETNMGYYQRKYKIHLYDYNKDGIKEVAIKHNLVTRIYFYYMSGKWLKL